MAIKGSMQEGVTLYLNFGQKGFCSWRWKRPTVAREPRSIFSVVFHWFLLVFRSFHSFSVVFGPIRTYSDAFRCVGMHSEAFRRS